MKIISVSLHNAMHVPNVIALQRVLDKNTYPDMVLSMKCPQGFIRVDVKGSSVLIPYVDIMNMVVDFAQED